MVYTCYNYKSLTAIGVQQMNHIFKLVGRVNSANADKLGETLSAEYKKYGELTLDADELEYISSAGAATEASTVFPMMTSSRCTRAKLP